MAEMGIPLRSATWPIGIWSVDFKFFDIIFEPNR